MIQRGETLTEVQTENGGGRVKDRGQRENPSHKNVTRKETQDTATHSCVVLGATSLATRNGELLRRLPSQDPHAYKFEIGWHTFTNR